MTLHYSSEQQEKLCLNNFENLIINQMFIAFKAIFDLSTFRIGNDQPKNILKANLFP